jgi:simple sugar transport system permease protein
VTGLDRATGVTDIVAVPAPEAPGPPGPTPEQVRAARVWSTARTVALYIVSLAVAFGISALLVAVTHGSPAKVFPAMFRGSLRSFGSLGYTLDNTAPLLIVAVGAIVSTRAGLFNIGQEGQVAIGAMAGAFVALKVHPAGAPVLVLSLLAAAVGGAIWAGIVALLRFWRGVEVVISSLLLVFVAEQVLFYSLSRTFLLKEHGAGGATLTESDQLSSKVQLPRFGTYPHFNVGSALIIALVLAAVVGLVMTRTTLGFRIRMLGHNPVAAKHMGIRAAWLGSVALLVSGACAGLAGGVLLTGQAYRITPTISNNVGWNGLLVALVARNNAWVAIGVAFGFGALQAGGGFLSTTGVPTDLVNVIEALVVLAAVFPPALQEVQRRRARSPATVAGVGAGGAAAAGAAA